MARRLLIAGGGIGGLAAALAATRAGWQVQVLEQAAAFSEVGAGVQLGPNATRVLRDLGRLDAVRQTACAPQRLVARDARRGHTLGTLPLGLDFEARYGAPYLTVHRADLHTALLHGVQGQPVSLHPDCALVAVQEMPEGVRVLTADGGAPEGEALVGADGLWSRVRGSVVADGAPEPSDHVAYRALIPLGRLPAVWQAQEVTAWLGPHLHAVTYPVRGGGLLNLVCVVRQPLAGPSSGWNLLGTAERLRAALGHVCPPLQQAMEAASGWGLWVLHDRTPVAGAHQMARGCIALLGDAAHPMRPYLAQGAAMALEDARALGRSLADVTDAKPDVPAALQRYARERWSRVARVQRRSLRNATIFHATGLLRFARDRVMQVPGVMDVPWLYAH